MGFMGATEMLLGCTLGIVLVVATLGCSPPPPGFKPPTLTERVYHANTVFQGEVLEKWEDPRFARRSRKAYIAKTKVFCILKGNHLAAVVNVSSLGSVGGRCNRIDVDVGKEYIMFGYSLNGISLEHNDMVAIEASEENINLATAACHLQVKYPQGIDATNAERHCPRTADPGDCTMEEHPPQMGRPPRPASPGGAGGPGGADDDDHDDHDHGDHDHDHAQHDHDGDGDHDDDDHHVGDHDHDGHDHGDHDHDGHDHAQRDGDHDDDDHHFGDHGHGDHDHDHDHDGDHDHDDHEHDGTDHEHEHDHEDRDFDGDHDHDDHEHPIDNQSEHDHDHDGDGDHDHDDHHVGHGHDHDDKDTFTTQNPDAAPVRGSSRVLTAAVWLVGLLSLTASFLL